MCANDHRLMGNWEAHRSRDKALFMRSLVEVLRERGIALRANYHLWSKNNACKLPLATVFLDHNPLSPINVAGYDNARGDADDTISLSSPIRGCPQVEGSFGSKVRIPGCEREGPFFQQRSFRAVKPDIAGGMAIEAGSGRTARAPTGAIFAI